MLGFSRSSHRYASRRREPTELLERLRAHAASRPRFGYRRLHLLLRRDGEQVNRKRVYRLYRLEGLSVRTKRRKRMVAAASHSAAAADEAQSALEHGLCERRYREEPEVPRPDTGR